MNRTTKITLKDIIINGAIILNILLGIENILLAYYRNLEIFQDISHYYVLINTQTIFVHRTVSVIIGLVLIFISYNLYKRMKMAWIIAICMLSLSVIIHIFELHSIFKVINTIQLIIILILAINFREFRRVSDPISLRNGSRLGLIVLSLIILNTCFAIYVLGIKNPTVNGLDEAIVRTLKMLFLIEPTALGNLSRIEFIFVKSTIYINWIGIIFALFFVLKPLIYQPIITAMDREAVRKLLKKYGDNPISYVSMENDKRYFFGENVEGVIVYTITAGVAVCVGDPLCDDENMPLLIVEFITYCKQNNIDICFCQTLEKHLDLYTKLGFGNTKYGEEAMFDLNTYNLSGGRAAKIRSAINHASAIGITVTEYKPLEYRNKQFEEQIYDISKEWLTNKKSSELSFMLGTTSLDNPMDRRYFVALDNENKMLGYIVFSPFAGGKGYLADVTRRKNNAPIGVMEKIIVEAYSTMKSEGVQWGSLGLAPLANAYDNGGVAGKLLELIYEKFNNFYGFKKLHHYKKKYGPTVWEPRYLVYYPKIFTPKIAYSIIKAQNPKGVSDFVLNQLKSILSTKNENL